MNWNSITTKRHFMSLFAVFSFVLVVASFMEVLLAREIPNLGIMPVILEEATIGTAITSKVIEMRTTGEVVNVSDNTLDIERAPYGSVHASEFMEFYLDKPAKVETGEKVYIAYINKDQRHIAAKVTKISKKKRKTREIKDDKPAYAGEISGRL
jgi:hypothetical protein